MDYGKYNIYFQNVWLAGIIKEVHNKQITFGYSI